MAKIADTKVRCPKYCVFMGKGFESSQLQASRSFTPFVVISVRVAELPDHHSGPFDRLLVAQALSEKMVLVTADEKLLPYDVEKLMA